LLSVVDLLEDGRWHVAGVLVEAAVVVPVDPSGGGDLDCVHIPPGALAADDLGLVQPVDALRQRVVIARADRPDRRLDTGVGEPLAVRQGEVLAAVVVMGDQRGESARSSRSRTQMACSTASRTRSAVMVVAVRQPRMRRA